MAEEDTVPIPPTPGNVLARLDLTGEDLGAFNAHVGDTVGDVLHVLVGDPHDDEHAICLMNKDGVFLYDDDEVSSINNIDIRPAILSDDPQKVILVLGEQLGSRERGARRRNPWRHVGDEDDLLRIVRIRF